MEPAAVDVAGLVKRYGATTAVDGLSFTARRGEVLAVLGPNGAGKTSTIEVCEGFRRADAGTVRALGLDPWRDRRALAPRVGVMLQDGGLPPGARAGEVLRTTAAFYRRPLPPDALLERLALAAAADRAVRRLSGGERQRLSLALALVGRPELVFLDEPTAGLDPQARQEVWRMVGELRAAGVTVILTTHYLEEAERLADLVLIVDRGRLVAAGSPAELTGGAAAGAQVTFRARPGLDLADLRSELAAGCTVVEATPGSYRVAGPVDPALLATLTAWGARRQVLLEDLRVAHATLEDVFLDLTGRRLR